MKMESSSSVMVKKEVAATEEFTTTPSRTVTDLEQQQKESQAVMTEETKTVIPKTVTPPEASAVKAGPLDDDHHEKQVRFGGDQIKKESTESPANNDNKDRMTTRRSRHVLPSANAEPARGAVLEFKTYRSPSRKRDEEVPSLCSTGSDHNAPVEKATKSANKPTSSISVDPSKDTTSPLASHDTDKNEKESSARAAIKAKMEVRHARFFRESLSLFFGWLIYFLFPKRRRGHPKDPSKLVRSMKALCRVREITFYLQIRRHRQGGTSDRRVRSRRKRTTITRQTASRLLAPTGNILWRHQPILLLITENRFRSRLIHRMFWHGCNHRQRTASFLLVVDLGRL